MAVGDRGAELMRALKLYIATANLATRAIKASRSKDASAEFSQQYQAAIENLHKAGRALKAISDELAKSEGLLKK